MVPRYYLVIKKYLTLRRFIYHSLETDHISYYIMYEDAGMYQYSPLHKITNYCAEIVDSLDFHACVQLVGVSRRYQ